jgi:hypothetical protein
VNDRSFFFSNVSDTHTTLRARYRAHPEKAVSRKVARTSSSRVPATDPFHGEVEIGSGYGASLRFGLDRSVGGLHDLPNPGDLLCAALRRARTGRSG